MYVDVPVTYEKEPEGYVGRARARAAWCHMIADSEEELVTMARKVGLRDEWIQRDAHGVHYDLVPSKRTRAIQFGAIACDRQEFVTALRRIGAARG